MCKKLKQDRRAGSRYDFILITGDLASTGDAEEYTLVAAFFDSLCSAAGVDRSQLYCIPGNHDVVRDRQEFAFRGARQVLANQSCVDALLAGGEDLEALIKRQENYRMFQSAYFTGQTRSETIDGLGFVSWLTVDGVRLAIVGLDSAWLSEGGVSDHGRLLIGERQIINALQLIGDREHPHVVIAMVHHPLHLLSDFDRRSALHRIDGTCHFLHCGHLHKPESRIEGNHMSGCLTVSAGPCFEARNAHNSYSEITLDLERGVRQIANIQYHPIEIEFVRSSTESYTMELTATDTCDVGELASAIARYNGSLARWAHYFAALLLARKTEFAIPVADGDVFGSAEAVEEVAEAAVWKITSDFLNFRRVLNVLYGDLPISQILKVHGAVVSDYGAYIGNRCVESPMLATRLDEQEKDSRSLAREDQEGPLRHTRDALEEITKAGEWELLVKLAERRMRMKPQDPGGSVRRYLAAGLAHLAGKDHRRRAIELYKDLLDGQSGHYQDGGNLASLLADFEQFSEAKVVVLNCIEKFPKHAAYYGEIGQSIVMKTGDREFRDRLMSEIDLAEGKQ